MNNIKLICTDIDGTLFNSKSQINKKDKEMLQKVWNEKKIPIALVSGRFKGGLTFIEEELGIPCIYSCFNGSYVEWQGNIIQDTRIDLEDLKKVIPVIQKTNSTPQIFDLFDYYFNDDNQWVSHQINMCGYEGKIGDLFKQIEIWEKENYAPYKMLAKNDNPEELENTRKALLDLNLKSLSIVQSSSFIIEIFPSSSHKGRTIELLANYFNISKNEIMAFGDYYNDVEMLNEAGVSIAMGNAKKEVKEIAKYTTDTNDNNGIAKAINKFIFDDKHEI